MAKKIISVIIAVSFILTISAVVLSSDLSEGGILPFSDIDSGKWYYEAVASVWSSGLMNGITEDTFSPNGSVTRAQFVTILARLSGENIKGKGNNLLFFDVKSDKYYSDALGWAVEKELVNGYPDNSFKPGNPILRRELAALIMRYLRYKNIQITDSDAVDGFSDKPSFPEWAGTDIDSLRSTGLVRGDNEGRFNPVSKTTRAEIATVLTRFLDNMKEKNRYDRVVIIGVDGAGAFFRNADTPNLDRIFENGSVSYKVLTSLPTISAQCWGSLLHGVTPEYHKLTNSVVASKEYSSDSPFPSVFRVIRENNPVAELASFCNWSPINSGIIENGIGVFKDGGGDKELTDKICEYIKDHDPELLFVQFDETDAKGHSNGFGSESQLEQITVEDGYIGRIYKAYEERGLIDDTLFIVTADHGGTGTSHGENTDCQPTRLLNNRA